MAQRLAVAQSEKPFIEWFSETCATHEVVGSHLAAAYHRTGGTKGEKQVRLWMKGAYPPNGDDERCLVAALAVLLPTVPIITEYKATVDALFQHLGLVEQPDSDQPNPLDSTGESEISPGYLNGLPAAA